MTVAEYWIWSRDAETSSTLCISMIQPTLTEISSHPHSCWSTINTSVTSFRWKEICPDEVYPYQYQLDDGKLSSEKAGFELLFKEPSLNSTFKNTLEIEALWWASRLSGWRGRATWESRGRGGREIQTHCRSHCAYHASPRFGKLICFGILLILH